MEDGVGGGMFVAAAVAGLVIWTAGGVKARGALLRDVSCYLISAAVVAALLASGTFTWAKSAFLIGMYVAFVLTVLAADTWHVIRNKGRQAVTTLIIYFAAVVSSLYGWIVGMKGGVNSIGRTFAILPKRTCVHS